MKDWLLVDHRPWLEVAISARDRLNHYQDGGLDDKAFLVAKTTVNGEEKVIVPHWIEDMTVRDYMNHTWHNLFSLIEQFTVGFLVMRFKEGIGFIHLVRPPENITSPIIVAPYAAIDKMLEVEQVLQQNAKKPS